MPMTWRERLRRYQRPLLVTAAVVGGGYLAVRYVVNRLSEFQDKAQRERQAQENLRRRFEQNQQDCTFTVLSLLPTVGEHLLNSIQVESIWKRLQESRRQRLDASSGGEENEEKGSAGDTKVVDGTGQEAKQGDTSAESAQRSEGTEAAAAPPVTSEGEQGLEKTAATAIVVEDKPNLGFEVPADQTETSSAQPAVGSDKEQEDKPATTSSDNESIPPSLTSSMASATGARGSTGMDKQSKMQLWEELKIASFTRTMSSIYLLTLITLLTHIQLNLLGRLTYISSVETLNRNEPAIRIEAEGSTTAIDFETERRFLSFSWWLLERGWKGVTERVERVVHEVLDTVNLKGPISHRELQQIVIDIRSRVEYEQQERGIGQRTPYSFQSSIFPRTTEDELNVLQEIGSDESIYMPGISKSRPDTINDDLRKLLDECNDWIDSPDFSTVLQACVDPLFDRLLNHALVKPFLASPLIGIQEIDPHRRVPLASVLPSMSRAVHLVFNGVPNEYIETLTKVTELSGFSAIVYSHFTMQDL